MNGKKICFEIKNTRRSILMSRFLKIMDIVATIGNAGCSSIGRKIIKQSHPQSNNALAPAIDHQG
jgi:hypothetical protein